MELQVQWVHQDSLLVVAVEEDIVLLQELVELAAAVDQVLQLVQILEILTQVVVAVEHLMIHHQIEMVEMVVPV